MSSCQQRTDEAAATGSDSIMLAELVVPYACTCVCVYLSICLYVCMYVCMYVYIYVYIDTCIHTI